MKERFERGLELLDQGRLEEAAGAFRDTLALDARHARARINLGVVLQQAGHDEAAAQCYRDALEADASLAQGWFNLGALQLERRRYGDAAESLRRALALDAAHAEWHTALAWSLLQSGEAEAAAAGCRGALSLDPDRQEAHSIALQAMHYAAGASAEQIHAAHLAWGRSRKRGPAVGHENSRDAARRLSIGYVAADFGDPAVAPFLQPVLARHDRSAFEVYCYSDARANDPVSWRLRARQVHWRSAASIGDAQFAQGVREDRIDILVDLGGHAAGGRRMPVFALRPAPLQLSWLGYPGTTGLDTIDYRITDGRAGSDGEQRHYTEQLIGLPLGERCYRPDFAAPAVGPLPARQPGAVTFGSFNDPARITAASLALWMRLLRELPESRLLLATVQADQLAGRVAAACRSAGVAAHRVSLETAESPATALALHSRVDINLDTVPCAGTVATLDSLWMGVPVVTLGGASLMEGLELRELTAANGEQYLQIAGDLARDLPRLQKMRGELRGRLRGSPLLDAAGFTRELETAYREIWRDWCAGTAARARRVAPQRASGAPTSAAAPAPRRRTGRNVIVDGVFFQDAVTGIARVWRSLLREWVSSGFAGRVLLLDRDGSAPRIDGVRRRAVPRHSYQRLDEDRAMLQRVCDEEQGDAFVSTYYSSPLATPSVMLAYDMIPELFGADLRRAEWREKEACILGASRIVAISANTARDLYDFYPQIDAGRITVAHCGVDPMFRPASEDELGRFREKYGIRKPYFLLVGSRVTYKNGDAFFRAFARIADRQRYAVVCAGGEPDLEPAQRQACSGCELHQLQVDDEGLRLAYAGAIALVYPSVYEGFGLPVAEAMASGCPVITTSRGSLPEVAADAALCVEPMNAVGLALALSEVQGPELRRTLIARGLEQAKRFSWTRMAASLASALSEVAASAAVRE